jgi:hypothetical protein
MINRLFIIALLLLATNQLSGTSAQAASVLNDVNRTDESTHLQLFFHCDQLPTFSTTTAGRRVDLVLDDTVAAKTLTRPPADDRMIKMTSKQKKNRLILSFYFRYPPQKVTPEKYNDTATLMLDILLGNPLSASFPELSASMQGVTVINRAGTDSLNPVATSDYAKNWISFFSSYETPVTLSPPPQLRLPPFPLAAATRPHLASEKWLPEEIQLLSKEGKWTQVSRLLRDQVIRQPDEQLKELLVLTYAESLVRDGKYKEPYILLQKIGLQYPDTLMASLARFLFIYLDAVNGDPFSAYYDLKTLFEKIEKSTLFTPYIRILLAELALMNDQPADAKELLEHDDVLRNEQVRGLRLLRQADLLYALHKPEAITAYLALEKQSTFLNDDPMSLARFADALYTAHRFVEAGEKYQRLSDALNNLPHQDLALFRQVMSQLHTPAAEQNALRDLQQIQDAFPHSEGGLRALLKQTDLEYVSGRMNGSEAADIYGRIANRAGKISLREEALFKQALTNHLIGENDASVELCMKMLREFQSGKLRPEAMALLIEQLSGVIKQLVADKEYIKALVLAKQNKIYFARGWLKTDLLYDLASAYSKLGLVDQATQTYQYLFEVSQDLERERIYLPLLETLFAAGLYVQVEEYADRYLLRYPKGTDQQAIYLLKVRAVYKNGQTNEAIKLLQASDYPPSIQSDLFGGRIFFEKKQWQRVIDTLTKPQLQPFIDSNNLTLALAESYFQMDQYDLATPLFRRMVAQGKVTEQAQFRLAQIALKKSKMQQALNMFNELADKGKDPLWAKLAREEVQILQLQQKR